MDKAIVAVLFPGWLAQVGSGGAALGGRAGRGGRPAASWSTSAGRKPIRTAPRRTYANLKNGCAVALRQLRDRITVQRSGLRPDGTAPVLGGLNGQSIARRLTAAARAAGIDARITGHSGRVGLASELTARGASTTETMLAGGWKTARMVAHYSASATAEQGAVAKYL